MANHGKIMEIGGGNPKRRVISQGELVKIVTTTTTKIRATKGVANGATFVARREEGNVVTSCKKEIESEEEWDFQVPVAMKEREELATACIVELDNLTGSITTLNKSKPRENSKKQMPTSSREKKLQEMQEMIKKLKVEKTKMENMLKKRDEMIRQKDGELKAKERELEKFRCEFKKLQELQDLKPAMMFRSNHIGRDNEQMKEKKKVFFEKRRPSTPYIPWYKDRWNKIKGKKFDEEKDQEVYIEVLRMGLDRLKHEKKVTNERVDRMSSNLKILRGDMLHTKTELSEKKEKEINGQNELALQKFKDHKTQWKVAAREAIGDEAIEPSTYEEASQYAEWRETIKESKNNIGTATISKLRENSRIKYSLSIVADKGLKKPLRTSARLKKGEVQYLETHSCRNELCFTGEKMVKATTASQMHEAETEKSLNHRSHSVNGERNDTENTVIDVFRWSRCKKPLPKKVMRSVGIPLPPDYLEVLEENLDWEDVQWSQTGAWIAGKEYLFARVHFLPLN
ncbi:uncharacterized protein LOC108955234 [Eucalyptus grandis]|uniref:uncharacterized protein LOC108955234 n=1 Tax=Eucalyptus grandis TaxID=71139 RepID=UPI00192EDDE6|nr:uncharacterized protein LOC108955234 [Eucalyptus grandis]